MTARFATSLPGFIPSGTVLTSPSSPFGTRGVDSGFVGDFERRFAAERVAGQICHAVAEYHYIFPFFHFYRSVARDAARAVFIYSNIILFACQARARRFVRGRKPFNAANGYRRKLFVPYAGVLKPELSERAKCAIFVGANAIRGQKNIPNRFGIFFVRR